MLCAFQWFARPTKASTGGNSLRRPKIRFLSISYEVAAAAVLLGIFLRSFFSIIVPMRAVISFCTPKRNGKRIPRRHIRLDGSLRMEIPSVSPPHFRLHERLSGIFWQILTYTCTHETTSVQLILTFKLSSGVCSQAYR